MNSPETKAFSPLGAILRIDVLRAMAILLVIGFHFLAEVYGYRDIWTATEKSWFAFAPLSLGWTGVALFFVISGYVIHRSFLLSPSVNWSSFASRRLWRIYPAYLVALGFSLAIAGASFFSGDVFLHIFLVHNFSESSFFSVNPSFWSLAIECQLYVLFPFALMFRRRWGGTGMFISSCVVAAISLTSIALFVDLPQEPWGTNTLNEPNTTWNIWLMPLAVWPSWTIGSLIAERHLEGSSLFKRPLAWAAIMLILVVVCSAYRPLFPLTFCAAAVGWATLVDFYGSAPQPVRRLEIGLARVGVWSYSIYLFHQPLITYFRSAALSLGFYHPALQLVVGLALFLPAVFAIGFLSYALIERPAVQIGARLWARGRMNGKSETASERR